MSANIHSDRRTAAAFPLGGLLAALVALALLASAWHPRDWLTWWLEVPWVLVGLPLTVVLVLRRGATRILMVLLALHALVLLVGAHYTYEEVPLGEWVQAATGSQRNNYDRLGHFMQGFVPAIIARELLRRTSPLRPGRWLDAMCVASAVAFSACFEMIEWAAAASLGGAADAFLGSQGDAWDAQWDMFCALGGAILAVLLLARPHERALQRGGFGQETA